jgi:hypothetical protein
MKHLRIVSLFLCICLTILLFPAGAAGLSDGAFYGGTAIQFGDLNDTLQYPQRIMGNTDNLTMEAWIKPTIQMQGNTSVNILYNGVGSSTYYYSGYGIGIFSRGLTVYLGGKGMLVDQTSLLNQNQWYHVALVREPKSSGGEWKLYLNGTQLIGLTPIDISITTDPQGFNGRPEEVFTVGNNPAISDQYTGCIDEVRVWNTARTAEQIRGDMYKKLNGSEANLVAYYDFENTDGFSVTPGGNNAGVTTVPNKAGASGALTLSNFALTGSISNFVSSMEAGTFGFSSAAYDVWENQSSVALTVTRSAPSDCAVSVGYATSDGTATAGTHYTSAGGTLTFAAGQTSKTITVPVTPNSTGGTDKSFTVTLTAPDGITVIPASATVTVKSLHTVDIAAIAGVTAPVTGGTRATAIAETAQYTGTVSWSPAHNPFREATAYTATISLTPKAGYTFSGVPANFFTAAGATAANSAGSGVVTAVFPYTAYATPAAGEGYNIDYANETIFITSGYEVSAGDTFDTLLSDGGSVTGYLGTSLYVRKAANGGVPASPSAQISVASRPVTPTASFSTSAMTLSGIDASMEYSLDGGTTWVDAPGSSAVVSGVTPEGDIRVRVKATGTAPASLAQLINILAQNAAPDGLTIDYMGETLNTATGMEYLNASGNWAVCTNTMALADLGWAGEALTVSLRTAGSGDAVASALVDVSVPARPVAPTGVTAVDESYSGAGDGSITGLDSTMEYDDGPGYTACDGDLTGLSPGEYLVRYRAVADAAFASEALTLTLFEGGAFVVITAEAGENGSISPSGAVRVAAGRDKPFTITPDDGYIVQSLLVDGVRIAAADSYTFTAVESDHSIRVTFEKRESGEEPVAVRVTQTPDGVGGASVTAKLVGNAFRRSVDIRITESPLADAQIREALRQSLAGIDESGIFALEIGAYNRGTNTPVQPREGTGVEITCPIPANLLWYRDMLVVVHLSDGTLQVLPAAIVYHNGVACLRFTASRFSPYAFVVDQYGLLGGAYTGYDPLIGLPKTGDGGAGPLLLLPLLVGALMAGLRKAKE